ncbi:MAG: PHP domain-containing protein [Coriobacteriia bacterium]|nr:PHP domain-containing protein [Coriobacteriia bacterium]MBN2848746.1 PHP domain-containing protein [Coriobacteriia bacterium]
MPRYTVDLHNHTPLIPSDYRGDPATTPRQIVERALELGIDVWGIADHFSVDYGPRLIAAAEEEAAETGRRLLVVPGAEIRVRYEGEETHLVCLFPPERADIRFAIVLDVLGLTSSVAPLEELPFFAVERDPRDVARIVDGVGGLCHIGHVDRTFGDYCFIESELVHDLAECPHVSAIELIDHSCRGRFRDGLAIAHISSSDSHSLEEMGRRTATLEMPELSFEGLKAAFRAARR